MDIYRANNQVPKEEIYPLRWAKLDEVYKYIYEREGQSSYPSEDVG